MMIWLACAPATSWVSLAAEADTVGVPWTGEAGITETVADIMARDKAMAAKGPTPVRIKPLLRPDRTGLPQNPDALITPDAPARAAARPVRGPLSPQIVGTSFTGSTLADKSLFPPDTMGAVGPSQFIVAVNNRFRSFNKTTGVADGALDVDPDVFFAPVKTPVATPVIGNFTSDPHIRYDRLSGRWIIVMIDVPYIDANYTTVENRIMIAVSSGGTITSSASFTFYQFRHDQVSTVGDTGDFADYPTPGIDANAIYIGDNVFNNTSGAFVGCSGFVVRKSSVLSGGPIVVTAFRGLVTGSGAGPYTPQGVDNFDPAATEGYFIGVDNAAFSKLDIRRVSTPGGTPTLSGNLAVTVPTTTYPTTVPHLGNTGGTSGNLDAIDDRLFAAHLRNGRLWTAHNIQVNASGVASSSGGRNGSRWYELQNLTSTPGLVESGTVFDSTASNPKSFWIPSIMVSGQGHVAMGFSTAGANNRANAATVGRLASDTLGTMQAPLEYTASSTAYNPPSDTGGSGGRRWGDYSYTSLDPSDDMTMWTIQEFCDSANSYGVRAVKLLAPPPATPANCSTPVALGAAGVNVVVTGTSSSGSGFYDPGSGFTKRISASVSGTGVTVNSVTYTSPTQITLNVSVNAGETSGSRTVTVTNPDGQSATSATAIFIILPANHPPVAASAFTLGAVVGVPATVKIIGGKHAPTDVDNDSLTITGVSGVANGVASTDGTNVTYTASGGSTDSFICTIDDGHGGTASQTVNVTITPAGGLGYNLLTPQPAGAGTNVITFLGTPNFNYALELATNLVPPVDWQSTATNAAQANGWLLFTNVTSLSPVFYRTRYVP